VLNALFEICLKVDNAGFAFFKWGHIHEAPKVKKQLRKVKFP